jgi:hypothetical protein
VNELTETERTELIESQAKLLQEINAKLAEHPHDHAEQIRKNAETIGYLLNLSC